MTENLICSIFIPLITFLIIGVFGRFFGKKGASFIAIGSTLISLIIILENGYNNCLKGSSKIVWIKEWVLDGIDWGFLFDQISIEMCLLITTITFCVLLFASDYMYHDAHLIRFMGLLVLFSFFMLFLVTSVNLFQMFVGWEGVGFVSYLLINFWFKRLEANRAAIKAMLFNRIGDSFFLIGLAIAFFVFKTSDLLIINYGTTIATIEKINIFYSEFNGNVFDIISLLFFLAAMGKSAQIGLHAWLPDAMEGPTPVSSLLHSATMVTAGVFLLIKLSPLFSIISPKIINFMLLIGALTACINAIFGYFQQDLKKIIAYSTCSQLGIMVVSVIYNANVGFYHLINHGFFKALLFISAGSVIHAVGNEQDIRKIGGCSKLLPFTGICMSIGSLALIGFPFLSGFFSKEFILFNVYSSNNKIDFIIFCLIFIASIFTILYSCKIIKEVFYGNYFKGNKNSLKLIEESGNYTKVPMFILIIFTMFFGFLNEEFFNYLGQTTWETVLGYSQENLINYVTIFFNTEITSFSVKGFLIFLLIWLLFFNKKNKFWIVKFLKGNRNKFIVYCFWLVSNQLGFMSIYRYCTQFMLKISYKIIFLLIDRGLFELFGPTIVVRFIKDKKKLFDEGKNNISFLNLLIYFFFSILFFLILVKIKFQFLFYISIVLLYIYFII